MPRTKANYTNFDTPSRVKRKPPQKFIVRDNEFIYCTRCKSYSQPGDNFKLSGGHWSHHGPCPKNRKNRKNK